MVVSSSNLLLGTSVPRQLGQLDGRCLLSSHDVRLNHCVALGSAAGINGLSPRPPRLTIDVTK